MAETPSGYKKKVIPTSDSTLLEEEFIGEERIIRTKICKVCKKPFTEDEQAVVCDGCRHYCHVEHSSKYQMRVYDHVCLVDMLGVSKQAYKVLYGISHGYGNRQMRNAAKLQSSELGFIVTDLKKAGLVREKLFFFTEITYKAHESLPILDEIYSKEKDVEAYVGELAGGSSGPGGIRLPSISSGRLMFVILSVGIIVMALIIGGAILSAMRTLNASSSLTAIVWILVMLGAVFVIYKLKGWFD